ncbi:Maelstrom domain [Trinorchestia longiramus]|nr:Maelstrom domain [Trinorchestia longiramus]
MPNKKKNKPNAYFTYMQSRKRPVEKQLGYSLTYEELNLHVGKEWVRMTPEEKARYAPTKTCHIPRDCYGTPLSVHIEEAQRKKKAHEEMMQGIKTYVDLHAEAGMTKLELVVVATMDYLTTQEDQVFPAEISLVRLSLGSGVDPLQYHAILKPPLSWPLGYDAKMRSHVTATHRLPSDRRSPDCVGADDFRVVATELHSFLLLDDGGEKLVPVYTLAEHRDIAERVLRQAFNLCEVKVWSLEELLVQTFVTLFPEQTGLYSTVHALDDITCSPDSPEYHPALGCVLGHPTPEPSTNESLPTALWKLILSRISSQLGVASAKIAKTKPKGAPTKDEQQSRESNKHGDVLSWHRANQPNETNYCSLNMAQRWSFMFLRALRLDKALQLELVPGQHTPGPNNHCGTVVHLSAAQEKANRRRHLSRLRNAVSGSDYSLYSCTDDERSPSHDVPAKLGAVCKKPTSDNQHIKKLAAKSTKSDIPWHNFHDTEEFDDFTSLSSFESSVGGLKKVAKTMPVQKKKHSLTDILNAGGAQTEELTKTGNNSHGLENPGSHELVLPKMIDTNRNEPTPNHSGSGDFFKLDVDVNNKHENCVSGEKPASRKLGEIRALSLRYKKIGAAARENFEFCVEDVENALQNTYI